MVFRLTSSFEMSKTVNISTQLCCKNVKRQHTFHEKNTYLLVKHLKTGQHVLDTIL